MIDGQLKKLLTENEEIVKYFLSQKVAGITMEENLKGQTKIKVDKKRKIKKRGRPIALGMY